MTTQPPSGEEQINALIGPPVEITDAILAECKQEADFTRLAHGLYSEAGRVLAVCSCVGIATDPSMIAFKRNQAICVGLIVRITKLMSAVTRLASEGDRREVVLALSRCIFESATNARFLILKNDNALYDAYVQCSLGPEREFYDKVTAAIAARGGKALPIEERMLDSIQRMAKVSGLKIEDVPPGHREWGGSVRGRIQALGLPDHAYASTQRFPSHAVHGTWVDLLVNHLEQRPTETGEMEFGPNCNSGTTDERLLGPIALYTLDCGEAYLKHFFTDEPKSTLILDRVVDLRARIIKVMKADELNVQKRHGQTAEGSN